MGEPAQSISQSKGDDCEESENGARNDTASGSIVRSDENQSVHEDSWLRPRPEDIPAVDFQATSDDEGPRPPLPPRPKKPELLHPGGILHGPTRSSRPNLQSIATTALSCTDVHTQSFQDGLREKIVAPTDSTTFGKSSRGAGSVRRFKGWTSGEGDDSASVRSFAPTVEAGGDVESLLGEVLGGPQETPPWKLRSSHVEAPDPFDLITYEDDPGLKDFEREFDELSELDAEGNNEEHLLSLWKAKRKHFLILSSAGKPIYNRHGDDNLISGQIGVIQTIISFYESAGDRLRGFTAGDARFVIMNEGPLYLVAISRLRESDAQLRVQLEALYMQILSTLTLPTLTHLFSKRPSTDLRRPLQGTEPLLSALADTFTRGSPPTLLSALECLNLRKAHRQVINDTLLQKRCETLLYGLIVAGGRLVSVVRPRRHSLHPSDLQLIFNMLFEAGSIKGGGGENWIPLCLPGFNKNGYLHMYVSFVDSPVTEENEEHQDQPSSHTAESEKEKEKETEKEKEKEKQDEIAILLISANKESFYDLRKMRDTVITDLETNGAMSLIKAAVRRGRPATTDIIPGTVLRHFLYKSRANVQFVMPSYAPYFSTLLARRKLLSLYHTLHASVHAKNAHLKVQNCSSRDSSSLAWTSASFELYCVAGPRVSRNALAQSANMVVQWARREEERVFIIGGAVF